MRLTIALFCVLALFAAVAAQTPTPCKSHEQWEGRTYSWTKARFVRQVWGRVSYDETNQRIRIVEEVDVRSGEFYYDILYLHNIGKMYRLNLQTRKCEVDDIDFPFSPMSVPSFAKFKMEAVIGATGVPGESVAVQTFGGEYKDGSEFETTVTFPDCVPVTSWNKVDTFVEINDFYDISLGISDPSVFIPPRECIE